MSHKPIYGKSLEDAEQEVLEHFRGNFVFISIRPSGIWNIQVSKSNTDLVYQNRAQSKWQLISEAYDYVKDKKDS